MKVHYASAGHTYAWCGRYLYNNENAKVTDKPEEVTCLKCLTSGNPSPRYLMEGGR